MVTQVLSDCTLEERKWLSGDVSAGIMLQLNKICSMTQTGQMPIESVTKVCANPVRFCM